MALHAKAKAAPGYRFYTLYDKVSREDVLIHAYACCKANQGAAGVDAEQFAHIEMYGENRRLWELAKLLRNKTYQPEAVRRVFIPKPNGKLRPLGIPTIRDRVVQTAVMLTLEPIFEADLAPEQCSATTAFSFPRVDAPSFTSFRVLAPYLASSRAAGASD